jgi:predicted PurR-regulated permease PerM
MTNKKLGWIGILLGLIGIVVTLIEPELRELLGIDKNFRIFIAILLFLALLFIILAWRPHRNNSTQNLDPEKEVERRHELINNVLQGLFLIVVIAIVFGFLGFLVYKT